MKCFLNCFKIKTNRFKSDGPILINELVQLELIYFSPEYLAGMIGSIFNTPENYRPN